MIYIVQPCFPEYRKEFFMYLINNFDITLIYSDLSPEGVKSINISKERVKVVKTIGYGGFYWQLVQKYIVLKKNDVLILSGNIRYLSNLYYLVKAKLLGVRCLVWGHSYTNGFDFFSRLRVKIFEYADGYIV